MDSKINAIGNLRYIITSLRSYDTFWVIYVYCVSASRAEEDETEASIIVEKLENEPKVSPKTNSNAFAFEDDTSNIKAAAVVVFLLLLS